MPAGRDSSTAVPGVLIPDWELPPGVRAAVSTRWLPGVSPSPFEAGNLGARCGDELENVAANRAAISVFDNSIATVSGPKPPGTGVIWLAISRTAA